MNDDNRSSPFSKRRTQCSVSKTEVLDTPVEYSSPARSEPAAGPHAYGDRMSAIADILGGKEWTRLSMDAETPTGSAGCSPVSNRTTSPSVLKTEHLKGRVSNPPLIPNEGPAVLSIRAEKGSAFNAHPSQKGIGSIYTLGSNEGGPVLRNHAEKGYGVSLSLATRRGRRDAEVPISNRDLRTSEGARGGCSVPTPGGDGLSSTDDIGSIEPAPVFLSSKVNPTAHVTSNPDLYARRWDSFAFRVKRFTCSLSRERRREIAARQRFRNQPYLRRTDEIGLDDCLP